MYGLDYEGMNSEIWRQVSVLEGINNVTSKTVVLWAQRVEAQIVQKEAMDSIKEARDFDSTKPGPNLYMADWLT